MVSISYNEEQLEFDRSVWSQHHCRPGNHAPTQSVNEDLGLNLKNKSSCASLSILTPQVATENNPFTEAG